MALCALAIAAHQLNCLGLQVSVVLGTIIPATQDGHLPIVGVLLAGNHPAAQ